MAFCSPTVYISSLGELKTALLHKRERQFSKLLSKRAIFALFFLSVAMDLGDICPSLMTFREGKWAIITQH